MERECRILLVFLSTIDLKPAFTSTEVWHNVISKALRPRDVCAIASRPIYNYLRYNASQRAYPHPTVGLVKILRLKVSRTLDRTNGQRNDFSPQRDKARDPPIRDMG